MRVALLAILVACGGGGASAPRPDPDPPPAPATELQIRQEAACEQAGPRIIECALADLKAATPPDELAQLDLDKMRAANTRKFTTACTAGTMSSRQVRVYEVCVKEETACEPFLKCLDNAKPQK